MTPGLAQHPLAAKMGDSPADVIAAAQQITPQLSTLFAHPLLQEGAGGRWSPEKPTKLVSF